MSQAIATTPRPALAPSAVTTPVSGWCGSRGSLEHPAVELRQRRVGLRDHDRVEPGRADGARRRARPAGGWRARPSPSAPPCGGCALRQAPRRRSPAASRTQSPTGIASLPSRWREADRDRAARERWCSSAPARSSREPVAVGDALGRVLAEDVTSADPVPGFDNSAMDGYAVRAADTDRRRRARAGPARRWSGESRAGHPAARELGAGEAIAISTGAMLPDGSRRGDPGRGHRRRRRVGRDLGSRSTPGDDIRRAGEDIEAGRDGARAPAPSSAPPSSGCWPRSGASEVACALRPRVTVLTTGDELQEPGAPLRPGAIRNSNAHSLAGLVERAGADAASRPRSSPTTATRPTAALGRGASTATSRSSPAASRSASTTTCARRSRALGVEQVFWRVALRPGKPTYFGVGARDGAALVFGLPGNPVSAIVTFLLFVRPAIRRDARRRDPTSRARATAILDDELPEARPGRAHMVRCRLELRDDGWHAHADQGRRARTCSPRCSAPTRSRSCRRPRRPTRPGERVEIELLP